MGNKERSVEK